MYCPQCGQPNEDTAKYCTQCGADLERYREQWWEGKASPGAAPAGGPVPGQAPGAPPGGAPPTPPTATPPGYPPPYAQTYPPVYGPPAYYPPTSYPAVPHIPSYMGWAIATLILCFWPTGIVAVVYASKVGNRLAMGDIAGAQEASRKAKMWCWITFAIGVLAVVVAIVASLLVAAATIRIY